MARTWCPEGGKPWNRIDDQDQCPHCGRMVSETLDGTVPQHIKADEQYHAEVADEAERLYAELTEEER